MTHPDALQRKIDSYFAELRGALRGVDGHQAEEFVQELRSHIEERVSEQEPSEAAKLDEIFSALGSPKDLAADFRVIAFLSSGGHRRSPVHFLVRLFQRAGMSVAGFFLLLGAVAGYLFGGILLLCAIAKFNYPNTAGLWRIPDAGGDLNLSFRLGAGVPPPGSQELLGWWIVPLALLAAVALILVTSRVASWCLASLKRGAAVASPS
jgi:hypothetical protein